MGDLKNKKVLVTGGGQGLGYAIVEQLLVAGADVAVHYFSSEAGALELQSRGRALGRRVEVFKADLTQESEALGLVQKAVAALGGLDVLINNAGDLVERRTIDTIDANFWARTMAINVTSMMWVTRAATAELAKAGAAGGASIVNLSSLAGRKGGHPGSLAYSTAKGAVLTWTRALANELGPKGVRVNAVAPGLILGTHFHNTHTSEASAQATIQGIPLGRAGAPGDVARAVAYLASEYDGFISGATIDINGGVYAA